MKNLLLFVSCMYSLVLYAQPTEKWNVNNPGAPSKEISFETTEGTWMNLDVSPDGKTIVFDLLGDIYTLPIAGGKATCIHSGLAWEVHPRFSPDGKKIAFCSDAGGGDNIWTMNVNGTDAKQITKETFRLLHNPVWTPDGQYIIARKHFTSTRSLGAGEMWMYHISGGDGIQLTIRKNDQQDVNEPSISPDGKYLYYSEDVYPGGYFQYNKNPNSQIYVIKRYNIEKGTTENFVTGAGGACRPQVSRDGKKLAYVRRIRDKSVLYARNIETGEEWQVYDKLTKDQMETWAIFGVYTNFAWLPGDQEIVIWSEGQINRVQVYGDKSGAMGRMVNNIAVIPFKATCKHTIINALRFKQEINPETFTVRVLNHARTSPDGKFIVFSAVGAIWKKNMPDGKPERITTGPADVFEFEPGISPDGKEIVFVTWNDEKTGTVVKYNLTSKKTTVVTGDMKGIFRTPSFSPDGKKITFVKENGNEQLGFNFSGEPGIYLAAENTKPVRVRNAGENPYFIAAGTRLLFQEGDYPTFTYKSCDLTGNDERTHFTSKYGNEISVSPDNKWVAFRELFKVYVAAFPASGKTVELHGKMTELPVSGVSRDAGYNLHWSADSRKLNWTLGNEYFSVPVNQRFTFLEGSPDSISPVQLSGIPVNLEVKQNKPTSVIALTNARIITMKGNDVIEKGTIIIRENKIEAVGKADEIKIPAGAVVKDMAGKTIMPGFVDVHAHVGHFRPGILPQKHWPYYANLAYGVTTTHDPSANTETVFGMSELVRAGKMVGPRIFSTGWILYGAEGDFKASVNSLEDARSAIRRTKAFGAFSVKSYNQPRREQRQMVIQAAREEQMMVVPEGGSTFTYNMTHIADGHTGVEHNIPVAPVYNDVIQFWKNSESGYTPTLIVAYGAMNGESYWYQHTNVWEKERLLRYTPRPVIDSRSRHRTAVPEDEYINGHILVSQSCKALADAGVIVNMGAHGQLQGLGAHWEIWMLQQGGMTNMEALRAATLNGAHYLGLDHMVGSLEPGKLADLIIMDANPLTDIKNTESIRYTMINGRLYDCETMNETGSGNATHSLFFWEVPGCTDAFELDTETCTFGHNHCSCGKH